MKRLFQYVGFYLRPLFISSNVGAVYGLSQTFVVNSLSASCRRSSLSMLETNSGIPIVAVAKSLAVG